MNAKQRMFCLEYAKSGNGTESAIKAGYAKNSARITASKLLSKANIQEELQKITEELESTKIAQVGEMQKILTSIIRQETQEEQIVVEGCGEGMSEARTMTRNPQLKDVIKAVETLAKMQGAFDNKASLNICIPVFGGEDSLEE